jgi:hypothetical protein
MGADVVWAQADELAAERQDRAGIGAVEAGDQVEARRLAGAVRPDQRDRLAFPDGKVEIARRNGPEGCRSLAPLSRTRLSISLLLKRRTLD